MQQVRRDEHYTYKGAKDPGLLEEAGGRQVLDVTKAPPVP